MALGALLAFRDITNIRRLMQGKAMQGLAAAVISAQGRMAKALTVKDMAQQDLAAQALDKLDMANRLDTDKVDTAPLASQDKVSAVKGLLGKALALRQALGRLDLAKQGLGKRASVRQALGKLPLGKGLFTDKMLSDSSLPMVSS